MPRVIDDVVSTDDVGVREISLSLLDADNKRRRLPGCELGQHQRLAVRADSTAQRTARGRGNGQRAVGRNTVGTTYGAAGDYAGIVLNQSTAVAARAIGGEPQRTARIGSTAD